MELRQLRYFVRTAVIALLTLPYGKFAHGIYRSAALLKWAIERRRPNPVRAGAQ